MEAAGSTMLDAARVPPERRALLRLADVRYRRQAYELTVPLADGPITARDAGNARRRFHAKHEQTYGHANRAEAVQLVNLRLTAVGRLPALMLRAARRIRRPRAVRARDVWFAETGFVETPVHWRDGSRPGASSPARRSSRRWTPRPSSRPAGRRGSTSAGYLRTGQELSMIGHA